jgi:Tfp pilus assembly protein PilX
VQPTAQKPGWYPDPSEETRQRWWDGANWSDQSAPMTLLDPALTPTRTSRHALRRSSRGTTMVLLSVAIALVGIVAVVILAFTVFHHSSHNSGNDQSGADAAAQSDLRSAVTTVMQCYTDNDNALPGSTASDNGALKLLCGGPTESVALSTGDIASYRAAGDHYVLTVTTAAGHTFSYDSSTGSIVRR